jgi:predicted transcriptional regulator
MNILLSIKSEYTEKIFSGQKKYEFRKQQPTQVVERIFIYECTPSKNIVGWFSIKKVLSGSPKEIWKKCGDLGGIEKKEYFSYCNGKRIIYALEIDRMLRFHTPINPFEIISDFKPPQNFSYLNNSPIFNALKNLEEGRKC